MTYKVRTLLADEYIQELEEELRDTSLVWDEIGISEMRKSEECFTTLQSGHLLCHSTLFGPQRPSRSRLSHKLEIERSHSEGKQHQPQSSRTRFVHNKLKIVQLYAPTTSYSDEDINIFYDNVDETLRKPNHYTIVMGDFNAQVGNRTNPMETATGKFGLGLRIERGDTLVEWTTSGKYKIITDVTVINQVYIGSDHRLVMTNIKLDVRNNL